VPLIAELLATPRDLPDASKYTVANGLFYMMAGLTFLAAPGTVQTLFADPPFAGHDEASVRVVGLLILTIGWLATFGGLSGGRRFVAATVVSRMVFVPSVLVPMAMGGLFPHTLFTFAILDPTLAMGAWILLGRDEKSRR
jgi:hypothetical protein